MLTVVLPCVHGQGPFLLAMTVCRNYLFKAFLHRTRHPSPILIANILLPGPFKAMIITETQLYRAMLTNSNVD